MILTSAHSPKALIVDLSLHYGGSTSRVLSLMKHMRAGEVELAGLKSGAVTQRALELGLPVHIVGNSKADPGILSNLIQTIRTGKFKILDSQNIQSKFWASLAAGRTNTSLVSTIHSWYANEHGRGSVKGKLYTTLELATNKNLSLYVTVSEKDRQSLIRSNIPDNKIDLIYNAVEVAPLSNNYVLKDQLHLPQNSIICLAVGRLVPIKGYDILIEAVRLAIPQIPNLVCIIIGEGDARRSLTSQIAQLGLRDQVYLTGYFEREKTLAALHSCDIFAMPSRYEGTPIALLEAAAVGCPIIASASGGIPELMKHEKQALLVPAEDANALANGLIRLTKDRDFAKTLGLQAQKHVMENFNLDEQVIKTRNAYQKAWEIHNTRK